MSSGGQEYKAKHLPPQGVFELVQMSQLMVQGEEENIEPILRENAFESMSPAFQIPGRLMLHAYAQFASSSQDLSDQEVRDQTIQFLDGEGYLDMTPDADTVNWLRPDGLLLDYRYFGSDQKQIYKNVEASVEVTIGWIGTCDLDGVYSTAANYGIKANIPWSPPKDPYCQMTPRVEFSQKKEPELPVMNGQVSNFLPDERTKRIAGLNLTFAYLHVTARRPKPGAIA